MNFTRNFALLILLVSALAGGAQTVPDDLSAMAPVLQARGEGVQIYKCLHEADWKWKLTGPEATLVDLKSMAVLGKHFAGPKWRLNDGSEVQGKMPTSTPHAGTIPWLVLEATSTGGAGVLQGVVRVTRTETEGGLAPTAACDAQHADEEMRVAYAANYTFYTRKVHAE